MKKIIGVFALAVAALSAPSALAGWGAIACDNNTGACSVSYGWGDLGSAENYAINLCGGWNTCSIRAWEQNQCVYYGAAYACN